MARQAKAYANQKAGLIKALQGSSRNKFTEDQLNAKSVDELEMLVELADVSPAPFAGRGIPMDTDVSQVG
ncbi:hypothetical protein, partial [Parvimonas sp. M20]|uniref:hypothetical protein n=1 Tax=Parvimonas sp. M20 TaxID=3110693 RepID=UPI002B4A1515